MSNRKWICLVEVTPRGNNHALGEAKGAFVNAIVLADDSEDLDVVTVDDVELFDERVGKEDVEASVLSTAERVSEQTPVAFASFHSFRD